MTTYSVDPVLAHQPVWNRINPMLATERLPAALLFVTADDLSRAQFADRLIALLLCNQRPAPCGECKACTLLQQRIHPDVVNIAPDKPGSTIKIEPVRALQQQVYLSPQLGSRCVVVIEQAERLNMAAANALLKIVEEPPQHVVFILMATNLAVLPATLLSRCQRFVFPESNQSAYGLSATKPDGLARLEELIAMVGSEKSPSLLASAWSSFEFAELLNTLYRLIAWVIRQRLLQSTNAIENSLMQFAQHVPPLTLFHQLDELQILLKHVIHGVAINQTLALESWLYGFLSSKGQIDGKK